MAAPLQIYAIQKNWRTQVVAAVSGLIPGTTGGGTADDTAAINAALEMGRPVDGGGYTYGITNLRPDAGTFTGLKNATLKWLTPGVGRMLQITDTSNWFMENVIFDLNNPVNVGSIVNNDGGLIVNKSSTGCSNFRLNGVETKNGGPNTGIYLSDATDWQMVNCHGHDFFVDFGAGNDPTDDCAQFFRFDRCSNFEIANNSADRTIVVLHDPTIGIYSNNPWLGNSKRWSRGFVFSGCSNASVVGCSGTFVDEAFDFSGSLGNSGITIAACKSANTGTYGLKFANSASDCVVTGFHAIDAGLAGVVVSGGATGMGPIPLEWDIQFGNCRSESSGSDGLWHLTEIASVPAPIATRGYAIFAGSTFTTYPRSIKFRGCEAIDRQGSPTCDYGFQQDSSLVAVAPTSAGYNVDELNEAIDCSAYGMTTAFQQNFHFPFVQLRGSGNQTISDSTDTALAWTGEDADTASMHSNSTDTTKIYIKKAGYYLFSMNVEWIAGAVGHRMCFFKVNGVTSAISDQQSPTAAFNTHVQTQIIAFLEAGGFAEAWVNQDSGGNLDVNLDHSTFQAILLR